MFLLNKKRQLVGFQANEKEVKMVQELVEYFSSKQEIGTVNVSDVLKTAISELHGKYINNVKNRYGSK